MRTREGAAHPHTRTHTCARARRCAHLVGCKPGAITAALQAAVAEAVACAPSVLALDDLDLVAGAPVRFLV